MLLKRLSLLSQSFLKLLHYLSFFILIFIAVGGVHAQQEFDIENRFTARDGASGDRFGSGVASDSDFVLIGAPGAQAVYVFRFNGSLWEEVQKLSGTAGGTFGSTLDIDSDYAIIGDRLDDEFCGGASGCNAGAAFIYKYNGITWNLVKKIFPEDAAEQNFFGYKVAISDDIAMVSAQYDYNNFVNNNDYRFTGSVYLFQKDEGGTDNWGQIAKFKSADLADGRSDEFGKAIDISNDYAVVGTNHEGGSDQEGRVYIFYRNQNGANQWGRQSIINPVQVGPEGGNFGVALSINHDILAIGDNYVQNNDQGNTVRGAISIFRLTNGDWQFESFLFPTEGVTFGQNICVSNENIAITPQTGISTYMYRFQEGKWVEKPKITNSDNFNISGAVSLSGVTLVSGATGYAAQKGAAYFFEFIATPDNVRATDGKHLNRTVITWKNRSSQAEGFRIYRDGEEAGSALSVATTYNDYDAIPGKLHTYQVSAYNNTWNESMLSKADLGWNKARGDIRGTVQTDQGAGIKDVEIIFTDKSATVGTFLSFDGIDDYVKLPYLPHTNPMTVSAWIRSISNNDQQIVGWGSASEESTIEFKLFPGGRLAYAEWNGSDWSPVISSRSINDGEWHFVSAVIDEDTCKLYIDGQLDQTGTGFTRDIVVTTTSVGAYDRVFAVQQFFDGDIDDVRIWKTVRSPEEIRSDMFNSLNGDENGLAGYWTFDDSTRSGSDIAADYKHDGGNHGIIMGAQWENGDRPAIKRTFTDSDGAYRVKNFYFEEDKEFRITPFKERHLFDPEYRDMALEGSLGSSADFTDTTSFTVSGRIFYAGTTCGVEEVELFLNDDPTGVFTDASGEYALAIEEPGLEYTITPVLGDSDKAHKFEPAEVRIVVEDDLADIDFIDTEKHLLYGKVRGGCIAGLGVAHIRVSSLNNPACFDTTLVTDFNGNYRVFLPAQEYLVDLIAIDYADSTDILKFFSAEKVDIRFENKNLNFIYHPPPIIQLTFFPDERTCDDNPVPIMAQSIRYEVLIEVLEAYGMDTCYVSGGMVTIYDDIGGNPADPVILPIQNGKVSYTIVPGVPNILGGGEHPYQKLLQIKADVEGRSGTLDQWVLVTGHRPRTPTFTSSSPELPFLVLRDPPGDQSYSFQAKGTTITTHNSIAYQSSDLGGRFQDMRFGAIASLSVGWGAGTTFSVGSDIGGYWIGYNHRLTGGTSDRQSGAGGIDSTQIFSLSLTATEEFRTSDLAGFNGEKADVFIGASLNQIFALTDVIDYDYSTCSVVRDTSLAMDVTGFKTTYVYTADHIRNIVIPQLQQFALLNPDSAGFFYSAIEVWEQALEQNSHSKKEAHKRHNISFSGGTSTTYTSTITKDSSYTIGYTQYFEEEQIRGLGVVLLSVPAEFGRKSRFEWTLHETTLDSTNSQSTVLGYTLADDDEGDFFSVDIAHDALYGTPVFNLVAGTSSCPWEPGTQPRDGVYLGIDKFVQTNVPPNEPATFTLTLGNTSESGEVRPYDLRVIQLSNPDGAIIKVGGVPMGNALSYHIPAGDSAYQATLTVERGPRAYDYENLQIIMVPPCEYDPYNSSHAIADTVNFSVHFASPLSQASLTYPINNWEINADEPDSLPVVINDYNSDNEYLKSLKLQYRKPSGSWVTAFEVARDQLPKQDLKRFWQYQNLEDGNYELRVLSEGWMYGARYSPVVRGRIERDALFVSGTPEPSDQVLNVDDQVAIHFTSAIKSSNINIARDISLIDASDSTLIDFDIVVKGNELIIKPKLPFNELGSRTLIARVSNIEDIDGKRLYRPVTWSFLVNPHTVYWKNFASEFKTFRGQEKVNNAILYNSGSTMVDYEIEYLPAWLRLVEDDLAGSIPPREERYLAFSYMGELKGNLNDSIMAILGGKREVQAVSLSILPEPPIWYGQDPKFAAYSSQVYARLVLNGQVSDDEFDLIGIFIDDQLSGIGNIRKDNLSGIHIAAITVYYPAVSGGTLEFRLWDASEGKEFRYYNDRYKFEAGSQVGNRFDPVIIEPNEIYQSITLNSGWNWISFNVSPVDLSIDRVLKDYPAEPGDVIKGQFGFSEYTRSSGWVGTLELLRPEEGYRVKSSNTRELITSGILASNRATPVALSPGWNWIGYLPGMPLALKDALYFVQAIPGDIIKGQEQEAIYNNNGEWLGTLRELRPGSGYILNTRANTALVYPTLKKMLAGLISDPEKPEWNVDVRKYESNMSLVGTVEFDGSSYGDTSLIVAAFINDECRGLTRLRYVEHLDQFILFLMIYGDQADAGGTIIIRIYDPATETTREIEDMLLYSNDGHMGNLQEPLAMKAMETDSERIPDVFYLKQNYPNPFNPLTTIEYGLPVDEEVSIIIFNLLGQKVKVLAEGSQRAGRYIIRFDAEDIKLASGIYFYRLSTQSFVKTQKMILLK